VGQSPSQVSGERLSTVPTEPSLPLHRWSHLPSIVRRVHHQYRRVHAAMLLTDVASVVATVAVLQLAWGGDGGQYSGTLILLALCPPAVGGVFSAFRLYRRPVMPSPEEFRRLIMATGVVVALLVASPWWPAASLRRLPVLVAWMGTVAVVLITRRMWRQHLRSGQRQGVMVARTLVVGTNEEALRVWAGLVREDGFLPVGLLATTSTDGDVPAAGIPVIGHVRDLPDLVAEAGIDCLFVASTAVEVEEMRLLSTVARWTETELRVTQNLPEVLSTRLTLQPIEGAITLALRPVRLTGPQALAKGVFDIVISAVALVLLLPIFLVVAAAIKATSPGTVLFRQRRVTRDGRVFTMYKFRTMRDDPDLIIGDPSAPFFKVRDDPRLTPVGRWLRRLSVDELPQLLNVLKREMSLVGPRPLPVEQVAAHEELLGPRHEVLAGLTGWWQIHGRSDIDPEEAARLDQFYIENWSLSLDLYIILKTFGAVVERRGAY
jgi:exopolysaccharide biosynthesis polyprenyl glycosylphosphotransferase